MKKLIGLSRAELTFLPVASLVWVVLINSAVFCNCSRFDRTPAVRTLSLIVDSALAVAAPLRSSALAENDLLSLIFR